MPLPGVTVTAMNTLTGQKATAWTDVDGTYSLQVPADGRYVVRAQMAAFAPLTHEAVINSTAGRDARVDLEMVLLSRAQQAAPTQAQTQLQRQIASALEGNNAAAGRGFQSLSLLQSEGSEGVNTAGADQIVPSGMPVPGMSSESATESVAFSGNSSNPMGNMSGDEFRQRIMDARDQMGGFGAGGGGFGGPGGGLGGGGFGGGGGGIFLAGARSRFDINRPHGSIYYTIGDSALNAAPFALRGVSTKPQYLQNGFGASIGGPLNIPHIYNGGTKTFYFVNYNGKRGENPFDQFSTVPTEAERTGDFSALLNPTSPRQSSIQLYDPYTGMPIPGNMLQNAGLAINPVAQGLLKYIPLPNVPGGTQQNFHFITAVTSDSDDLNVRVNRTFGAAPTPGSRGGRGGGGGRGGSRAPRNNLTFGLHYHGASSNLTNPFPSVGGSTNTRGIDVNLAYIRSIGKLTNVARVDFNRLRARTQNLYANSQNVAGALGITGVSENPFDWGLPNLSFSDFASLGDINPLLQRNQTWTFSDNMICNHGKHTWRWGGDFRRIELNQETDNNARGSFVFNGLNTALIGSNGQAAPNTGFDFADFLLGLPEQTSLQRNTDIFGTNNYHFRGNSWDVYGQDEWKLRGNLTFNLGVRYEYISPFTELNDRIANLILSPGVLSPGVGAPAVTPVLPNQGYPATLVRPDRNNFAPRVGFAWKPFSKTVVRGGYGINYNTGAYQSIVQNLAFQPPFALTETNVQTGPGSLSLQNGFVTPTGITNSYAVNPNYRMGYVQIRNLDIQQQIRPTLLVNVDYTGTKGTDLDDVLVPNGGTVGFRIPNTQAFTYQTSLADSAANAGSIRVRKRLQHGVSIGGTYTYSKSIDDASSIGNGVGIVLANRGGSGGGGGGGGATSGTTVVAQNPFNLAAERGLSSFDQRHKFSADYLWELPFGSDRRWLTRNSPWRAIFGDWQWSGNWTIASGLPFTPRVLGDEEDVLHGTNGTIRADVTGAPLFPGNLSFPFWFNPAAFALPTGQFGDARRNSIAGPGEIVFDMAITKMIPMKETRNLEVRASASNVFNHPQFTTIDTNLNSPTFGQIITAGAMRTIQMTARFRF